MVRILKPRSCIHPLTHSTSSPVTRPSTLDDVLHWHQVTSTRRNEDRFIPRILLGNKVDLARGFVEASAIEEVAYTLGAEYFEVR